LRSVCEFASGRDHGVSNVWHAHGDNICSQAVRPPGAGCAPPHCRGSCPLSSGSGRPSGVSAPKCVLARNGAKAVAEAHRTLEGKPCRAPAALPVHCGATSGIACRFSAMSACPARPGGPARSRCAAGALVPLYHVHVNCKAGGAAGGLVRLLHTGPKNLLTAAHNILQRSRRALLSVRPGGQEGPAAARSGWGSAVLRRPWLWGQAWRGGAGRGAGAWVCQCSHVGQKCSHVGTRAGREH